MVLTLNRQDKRNALTQKMYTDLIDHLNSAEQDPAIRAILVQGDNQCFCAGNDLQDFLNGTLDNDAPVLRFVRMLPHLKKPLVAAVAGPAVGIGTTLLLYCDLVYATEDAKLMLSFVNQGLVPEAGSTVLLPALMGHQRSAELLLLGRTFSGAEAHEWGLVTRTVPAEQLLDHALTQAKRLASQPQSALTATVAMLRDARPDNLSEVIDHEIALFLAQLETDETKARIARMLKR
ncbi:enoyl-CoA hydratase [Ferrimonas gelatinilytica]|uniref:Enoyl-CoA hydratase n=2 Tax=Ferrimonas gelatinilytica TaxID=1255257 RepID=A0ABP9S5U7_9GAMM